MNSFKVDAIGIGYPKCGTEWILQALSEHPEVNFAKHKEINFFLSKQKGLTSFVYENMRVKTWDEYIKQFDVNNHGIKIEFDNHYIFDKKALLQIKDKFPNVKILIALRDPVEYLYSIYWYMKYSNVYNLIPDTFEKGLEVDCENELFHKNKGYFYNFVSVCYEIFDQNNIHIILLDEIKKTPKQTLKNLYEFLQIDSKFTPTNLNKKVNKTQQLRFPKFMLIINKIIYLLSKIGLSRVINYLINTTNLTRKVYKFLFHTNKSYPPIDLQTRKKLKKDFKPDIINLEKLINKDLGEWYI